MASEFSFDVVSQFDLQELKNAIDQVKREIVNRYDLKGSGTEMTLGDNDITVIAPDTMKLAAVKDVLFQKLINRGLSPKILDIAEHEPCAGGKIKQVMKLIKVLSSDNCKSISKHIKDGFPKVKASIQGECVRVSSKNKDDLQGVMISLKEKKDINVPLDFTNYR